jgi:hypothetical protein
MKAISHFLRITVLGGVLFLTPIVLLVFILGKAFDFSRRALKPVTAIIPDRLVSGATTEAIVAIVLIAILCFLAGLFARTRPAQRIMGELESSVLSKVPAYEYLKQAGASVMGLGEMADHPVVLTQQGGAWRIAVQTGGGGRRLGRGIRPQFPKPDVRIGISCPRRQCPPRGRSTRHGHWLPPAVRRWVGSVSKRVHAQRPDSLNSQSCSPESVSGRIPMTWVR